MKLSCASLRLEAGDRVTVRYRPASSMPLNNGEPLEVADALHAQLGELHIFSRPAVVARLLSEALSECFAMWGDGHQDGPGDNPDDLGSAGHKPPLPPWPAISCSRPRCQGSPPTTAIAACP